MKKFLIGLFALVLLFALIFWRLAVRTSTITVQEYDQPLIADMAIAIPISDSDPILGNPGAPLTIVEFMDLNCSACIKIHGIIKEFVWAHPQEARLIWKDAPKSGWFGGADYDLPHRGAQCAASQGKFWQYLNAYMADASLRRGDGLAKIAAGLGLNTLQWNNCIIASKTMDQITSSTILAAQLGVDTLPGIFVNNKLISIPPDLNLKNLLDQMIAK